MSKKCDDCGRYSSPLTEVVLIPASPYQDESTAAFCARCLELFDRGWDQCSEAVADRDGIEGPCDRPAYGVRVDDDFGGLYPVCRKHYRPPFELTEAVS